MKNKLKLTQKELKAIEEYEALLIKRFPRRLRKIILFGSKARGDSNRASDLDLLIVVSRNGKRVRQEVAILTHEPIAKYMVDISPITVDERFLKEWSPLLEHIKKDGVTLWTNRKGEKSS